MVRDAAARLLLFAVKMFAHAWSIVDQESVTQMYATAKPAPDKPLPLVGYFLSQAEGCGAIRIHSSNDGAKRERLHYVGAVKVRVHMYSLLRKVCVRANPPGQNRLAASSHHWDYRSASENLIRSLLGESSGTATTFLAAVARNVRSLHVVSPPNFRMRILCRRRNRERKGSVRIQQSPWKSFFAGWTLPGGGCSRKHIVSFRRFPSPDRPPLPATLFFRAAFRGKETACVPP